MAIGGTIITASPSTLASSVNTVAQSAIGARGSTRAVGISNGSRALGSQRKAASGTLALAGEIYSNAPRHWLGTTGTNRVTRIAGQHPVDGQASPHR